MSPTAPPRALVLSRHRLYPAEEGSSVRIRELAEGLSRHGWDAVTTGLPGRDAPTAYRSWPGWPLRRAQLAAWSRLSPARARTLAHGLAFDQDRLLAWMVRAAIRRVRPALIQAEHLMFLPHAVAAAGPGVPVVYDAHNVEFIRLPAEGVVGPAEAEGLRKAEVTWASACARVIATSDPDADRFREAGVTCPVSVVGNGVSFADCAAARARRRATRDAWGIGPDVPVLVFHGTLHYRPNEEAEAILTGEVFPRVRKALPEARLLLLGPGHPHADADGVLRRPALPRSDLLDAVAMADLAVAPLRQGSGTRLKLLEYAALGVPMVSTPIGAEGLPLEHPDQVHLAEEPEALASAAITLWRDPPRRAAMAEGARNALIDTHDWDALARHLAEILRETLPTGRSPRP